jgi:hypothetical protein
MAPERPYEEVVGSLNPSHDPDLERFINATRKLVQSEYRRDFMDSEIAEVPKRIRELSKLKSGWLDGVGNPISAESLRSAQTLALDIMQNAECGWPRLFPTEEGGVQLQWRYDEVLYTIYIKPGVADLDVFIMEIAEDIPSSKHYNKQGARYDEVIPYLLAPREDSIHE